jgi:mRNA-degrading endonuclease toxin of MazEF toxin-antitoxin module
VVAVKAGIAGLTDDCSALCHQIATLERAKLTDKIGELPLDILGLLEQALLAAVGVGRA